MQTIEVTGSREGVLDAFEIRAQLDRAALRREDAVIRQYVIRDPTEVKKYDHAWQNIPGVPGTAGWDWIGVVPVQVAAAAADPTLISEHRAARAAQWAQAAQRYREYGDGIKVPVRIQILTFAVGERLVVVDGNNAMAGLAVLLKEDPTWPFVITEERIHGEVAGETLPDLYHYTEDGVPKHMLKKPE